MEAYLVIAGVLIGVGLAIWVAIERAARHKAELALQKSQEESARFKAIAENNAEATIKQVEENKKLVGILDNMRKRLRFAREELIKAASVSELRDMLDAELKEETL